MADRVRICVIGNSHMAALRDGWPLVEADHPGLRLSFFGQGKYALRHIEAVGTRLIQPDPVARQWMYRATGVDAIETEGYDGYLLVGLWPHLRWLEAMLSVTSIVGLEGLGRMLVSFEAALAAAARAEAAERERLEQELRERQEKADEERRRRKAAELARRRRAEERRRRRHEAERQRREAAEQKEREAAEAARRRAEQEERRRREARVAAERARVQAERRAREEAEAAERERQRLAAEAERERQRLAAEAERRRLAEEAERERQRLAAEAAEAERRRRAEEEARRLAEAAEAARRAAEAERAHRARVRRFAVLAAESALARARLIEDAARAEAARAEEEAARLLREHQDRESRALYRAARELEGPEVIPAASHRPLLSRPEEALSDEELFERARAWLPDWRRRERLSTKAAQIDRASSRVGLPPRGRPAEAAAPAGATTAPGRAAAPHEPEPASPADRRLQLAVLAAWAAFVAAGAWGLGLLGRLPGLHALDAGSYLSAHDDRYGFAATVFSLYPLHPLIWPMLWLGLGGYAVRQALPGRGGDARDRATRGPAAGAMLAVATWFPPAALVPWGLETLVWLVALALMVRVIRRLTDRPARDRTEELCTDGVLGLFTGVLLAGAPTAVGAALQAWGVRIDWFPTALAATAVLLGVLLLGLRLALTGRGRMGLALGMAWTLLCLGLPRLLPSPLGAQQSAWVGLTAVFGGLALLLVTSVRRSRVLQAEQRAARSA